MSKGLGGNIVIGCKNKISLMVLKGFPSSYLLNGLSINHIKKQGLDQPGKVAIPAARGQLNRGK